MIAEVGDHVTGSTRATAEPDGAPPRWSTPALTIVCIAAYLFVQFRYLRPPMTEDSMTYLEAATAFPDVATDHWSLRIGLLLPLRPLLEVFGPSEVAYYGGKVLHPATLLPAVRASIPVVVRNTLRPAAQGSRIVGEPIAGSGPVRAIVHKTGLHLVSLVNPRMLMQPGYLAEAFSVAARHGIDVGIVATSEVSITMTTDAPDLTAFAAELAAHGEVRVEAGQGIVGVVGHGIAESVGVPGQVFSTLAEQQIRVRVISQGAIKVNIALVVADADVPGAVRALHAAFFGPSPS